MKRQTSVQFFISALLLFPVSASAQGVQEFIINLATVLNATVIPTLIGIAFLIFIWNAIRYFVLGGSNQEGREKARALATYGLLAFVVIIVFAGIVNMFADGLGLEGETNLCPDYQDARGDC